MYVLDLTSGFGSMTFLEWEARNRCADGTKKSLCRRSFGEKPASWLKSVYENSRFHCFVYHDEKLIGAGRALADGFDCSYICDLAVRPRYQGMGIGKQVVNNLVKQSAGHRKIILYSVAGKQDFYGSCGFHPMKTAMAIFADEAKAQVNGLIEIKGELI